MRLLRYDITKCIDIKYVKVIQDELHRTVSVTNVAFILLQDISVTNITVTRLAMFERNDVGI